MEKSQKLTSADMQELRWWFNEPPPASETGHIVAQTYEPRGSGVYDPTTDYRLETMVGRALARARNEWQRIKSILDRVGEQPGGRAQVDTLRAAFAPAAPPGLSALTHPELALGTKVVRERAKVAAVAAERQRLLELAYAGALRDRVSPMTVAVRVLELDQQLAAGGVALPPGAHRDAAEHLLERALAAPSDDKLPAAQKARHAAFVSEVEAETQATLERAGGAYRRARTELGATKKAAREERERQNAQLLEDVLDGQARRAALRFEEKLRRAS